MLTAFVKMLNVLLMETELNAPFFLIFLIACFCFVQFHSFA